MVSPAKHRSHEVSVGETRRDAVCQRYLTPSRVLNSDARAGNAQRPDVSDALDRDFSEKERRELRRHEGGDRVSRDGEVQVNHDGHDEGRRKHEHQRREIPNGLARSTRSVTEGQNASPMPNATAIGIAPNRSFGSTSVGSLGPMTCRPGIR